MLRKTVRYFLLLCLLFGPGSELLASHILGGGFRFESLNSCTTRVHLELYYDCTSPIANFPTIPPIGSNQISVLSDSFCLPPIMISAWTGQSVTETTPICPGQPTNCTDPNSLTTGYFVVTYSADYDLCAQPCNANNYTFVYESCCRSSNLLNLVNPGANGTYITSNLENLPNLDNNSPIFNQTATPIVCIGQGGVIDLGAYDVDGDSIWYSLTTCMDEQQAPVTYGPGFSPTQPLGAAVNLGFDSQTGIITIPPSSISAGSYQVCVEVHESRNGQYLGSVIRDFAITTLNCPSGVGSLPSFSGLQNVFNGDVVGPNNIVVCEGQSLSFEMAFSDADPNDIITVSSNALAVLDSSTFISSGTNPASGVVTWTPGPDNAGQTYTIYATASSAGCPVPGTHTEVFYISVGANCLDAVVTNSTCNGSTGAIDLTVNASNPPFSFQWSNGATTEDLSGLPIGLYVVTVSNANGLTITDSFYVSASDIMLNPIVNQPNCDQPTGAIGVNPVGGTAPYTYQWNTGASSQAIGGLNPGGYSVIVTDSLGCFAQEVFLLETPDSCHVTLEGTVFDDQNGNCIQDPGENGIPFVVVDMSPGGATLTDGMGHYQLISDTGNVSLSVVPPGFSSVICPPSGTHSLNLVSFDDDSAGLDFAMDFLPVQDLQVNHVGWVAVPGISRYHYVYATNQGNIPMSGTVRAFYSPDESLISTINPPPSLNDPSNQLLEWSFSNLAPGAVQTYTFFTQVDTAATPGDSVKTIVSIEPVMGDTLPLNNYDTTCVEILASYDPNDKQVSPAGVVAPATGQGGYILPTEDLLEYTVRFQNTGNYPAQVVVIRDTIDHDLNALSYRPAGASHPYSLMFEGDSVLVFTFANINLPDSVSDPQGSQGFVAYTLQHAASLSPGTQIDNRAAIYFDYNPPIITNTVRNTIFTYPEVAIDSLHWDYLCFPYDLTAQLSVLGTSPYTYQWNTGAQGLNTGDAFATPIDSSRFYSLTVTDALGFETSDSAYWEVRYTPVAEIIINGNPFAISLDFSAGDQNASSYYWDFGDGTAPDTSQNPIHTYAFAGFYDVLHIVENECGADTAIMTVNPGYNSITDSEFARSIKVIPNPFRDQTEISFDNPQGHAYGLRLYDQQGRIVREYAEQRGDHFRIERGELRAGLYLFEIHHESGSYTAKLMIQ